MAEMTDKEKIAWLRNQLNITVVALVSQQVAALKLIDAMNEYGKVTAETGRFLEEAGQCLTEKANGENNS